MKRTKQFKLALSLSMFMLLLPMNVFASAFTLIPMGHSIGITMDLAHVFVTNEVQISDKEWLYVGDAVHQIGEQKIQSIEQVQDAIQNEANASEIATTIMRNGEQVTIQATHEQLQNVIPFLKDKTEGTGTLTYIDLQKKSYGALGHQIIDSSLQSAPIFSTGFIYLSEIEQIRKSTPGRPGYKISTVTDQLQKLGTIQTNNIYGIFGVWSEELANELTQPMEILPQASVVVGKAQLLTTVEGTNVEAFDIEITNVENDQFLFTLVDSTLIEKTGGILQGMSGSPIIQNDKFAGAVTHMYVDEPKKGAALYIEKMRSAEK